MTINTKIPVLVLGHEEADTLEKFRSFTERQIELNILKYGGSGQAPWYPWHDPNYRPPSE